VVFWTIPWLVIAKDGEAPSPSPEATVVEYRVKTTWAVFKVKRVEQSQAFETWVSSDTPLDGWLLVRKGVSKPLGRKTLNGVYQLHFKIQEAFSPDLVLTVFPWVDGSPQPLMVPSSDHVVVDSEGSGEVSDPWMQWRADPSRPYNRVVQGLFQTAVKNVRAGRVEEAMKSLDQALDLDSSNPQVLDLREHLVAGEGSPKRVQEIVEIQRLLKDGSPKAALEKADALLAQNATDVEILELKRKIEAVLENGNPRSGKKKQRVREAVKPPAEDPDARGRADQAYNLGLESYRKGNWAGAKSFWDQALQNDPHHLQARRALDRLLAEQPSLKTP
jgi:tetratricopeptide (TPR) repeat protein